MPEWWSSTSGLRCPQLCRRQPAVDNAKLKALDCKENSSVLSSTKLPHVESHLHTSHATKTPTKRTLSPRNKTRNLLHLLGLPADLPTPDMVRRRPLRYGNPVRSAQECPPLLFYWALLRSQARGCRRDDKVPSPAEPAQIPPPRSGCVVLKSVSRHQSLIKVQCVHSDSLVAEF